MWFGRTAQKVMLAVAALFAVGASLYALGVSIFCAVFAGDWFVLVVWLVVVGVFGSVLAKLFLSAWKLLDKVYNH